MGSPAVRSQSPDLGRELNFIIGGNILGRGLTIDNLLVTYYLRRAKVSQMDTVLQHARMFGYRAALMPFTRVFLPEILAFRFHHIHAAESRLRRLLSASPSGAVVPVETVLGLRATRLNVLDASSVCALTPGDHIYPFAPAVDASSSLKGPRIEAALRAVMGGSLRPREFVKVRMEEVIELMMAVPYDSSEAGSWDPDVLAPILSAISDRYRNQAFVHYRTMTRSTPYLGTGAASGDEVKAAVSKDGPVLFLFRDDGSNLDGRTFWYPSLVFPSSMATQVFNVTS